MTVSSLFKIYKVYIYIFKENPEYQLKMGWRERSPYDIWNCVAVIIIMVEFISENDVFVWIEVSVTG